MLECVLKCCVSARVHLLRVCVVCESRSEQQNVCLGRLSMRLKECVLECVS